MDSVRSVGVIDKTIAILRALAGGPLDLAELQVATGMPRATAHRLAVALEAHRLVRRDRQGRFCLGYELIALGRSAADQVALRPIALPILQSLRDTTGESVQLFVREGEARRCVVSLESPHGLRWIVPEASLLPLDAGSAGRVLAGPADRAAGRAAGRRDDWVESVEEREAGVASVSAPVLDSGGAVIAAVSVSGPIERLSRAPGRRFGDSVVRAAEQLARACRAVQVI